MAAEPAIAMTTPTVAVDFSYVPAPARIAVYDDLRSAPRILQIDPAPTAAFIESLTTAVYEQSRLLGGSIPYTVIREVSENFIHAAFKEIVVSVLDGGDTIRFADQGPGIIDKDKVQQPGFSSATAPMKQYIHGVGSGLPIVREYMETKNGTIQIEDNIDSGAVITISLNHKDASKAAEAEPLVEPIPKSRPARTASSADRELDLLMAGLSKRAYSILSLFVLEKVWGVTDISKELELPPSSTFAELNKLEEAGIITKLGKKRALTDFGAKVVEDLHDAL